MRSVLVALALLAGTSAASAEVWLVRDGKCGDWRSRWNVEQDQSGVWVGVIELYHVGGPCIQGTGRTVRIPVKAVIAGESFFASRRADSGTLCNYYGRLREDRVRGAALCDGEPDRWVFALRFPPGNSELRQRHDRRLVEREDDDWLDDPRTLDRSHAPSGFNLEFRLGPRQ